MPNVPTYIRSSDLDKYLAIQSKGSGAWSAFIHNALNEKKVPFHIKSPEKQLQDPDGPVLAPKPPDKPRLDARHDDSGYISKAYSARKKK